MYTEEIIAACQLLQNAGWKVVAPQAAGDFCALTMEGCPSPCPKCGIRDSDGERCPDGN